MKKIFALIAVVFIGSTFLVRGGAGGPGPKGTPNVVILAPANLYIAVQGTAITIKAAASESGGTITKVEYFANSAKIGEVDNAPYNFNWLYPDTGVYLIQVKATDAVGGNNSAYIYVAVYSFNTMMSSAEGDGLGLDPVHNRINLGDTITGVGAHSFHTNRYQHLNGYQYSFGGGVNDPVNHPVWRLYNNGDWSAGTTMDTSVNTKDQTGMRYYAKPNILTIGASDRLDTTQSNIGYGIWPTSGIIINSDEPNSIKARLMNTVFEGDANTVDSGFYMENNFMALEASKILRPAQWVIRTFFGGYNNTISATTEASVIDGAGLSISRSTNCSIVSGYQNTTMDSCYTSIAGGAQNKFGGLGQLTVGYQNTNRAPYGVAMGNGNVDFATLPYTGVRGTTVAGIAGYPLFSIGNSGGDYGAIHSNALTMLYNGRTQINTTGLTSTLSQTAVTPQAALDVVSTNTGVLLPRLTNAQRNAIGSGDLKNGLLLYNTDSSVFQFYNGSAWNSVGSGGLGIGGGRWLFSGGSGSTIYDSLDNIAIGTSNPQGYKLAVNGAAIFNTVKVKATSSWPDYVFDRAYALPGLTELERYIQEHHHLPGIASAREVEEKGIDVGENQTVMLKKMEEMTLYIIKQDKQQEEQKSQLDMQRARLDAQQKEIEELKALIGMVGASPRAGGTKETVFGGIAQDCLSTHVFNDCSSSGYITLGFNAVSGASSGVADPLTVQRSNLAVGINNTNPQARLHIKGAGADNTTSSLLVNNSANAEVFRILDNGNIGIGTAAPQSALAVNGTITTKKITATPTGWADYVFDPGYKVMPLGEVEEYIREHHHLPEMVPAADVEKNGVDLGANQAALLKKVEELTLYLIEEHKEIEKLKTENHRLSHLHTPSK